MYGTLLTDLPPRPERRPGFYVLRRRVLPAPGKHRAGGTRPAVFPLMPVFERIPILPGEEKVNGERCIREKELFETRGVKRRSGAAAGKTKRVPEAVRAVRIGAAGTACIRMAAGPAAAHTCKPFFRAAGDILYVIPIREHGGCLGKAPLCTKAN